MPQRLRVKNIQDNADILADLNICADDPRLYRWIDAFEQQALVWGRWWGTTQLVQFCLTDSGCIVLPRQIATIEAANLGARHTPLRNGWYDFVRPHSLCEASSCSDRNCGCGCGAVNIFESGMVASFKTTANNTKVRVYPGNAADVGKKIIFQGKDSNGIWVRTTIDGTRQDGEQVTLALPFVDTVTVWGAGAPFRVIKEATQYRVLVYSVTNDADATETQLADYEPSETEPAYRRVNVEGYRQCETSDACCSTQSLTAIVSLDKIPVQTPNDWLLFTNPESYRLGLKSIQARKDNPALADALMFGSPRPAKNRMGASAYSDGMSALSILRAELRKYTSDTTSVNIQTDETNLIGFL